PPVCGRYRAFTVCGMGPPSSGAVAVQQILGIVETRDMSRLRPGPDAVHWLAEAGRLAFADRALYLGDPAFVPVPLAGLIDPGYVASRAALVNPDRSMGRAKAGEPPQKRGFLFAPSDGIENGYPYRAKPPAGVIGWYDALAARAKKDQPQLARDIAKARAAIVDFHAWMVANRPRMTAQAGVGEKALDWFLRHGLLMPYTSKEVETLAEREFDRLWAFYGLERFRNRGLPEVEMAKSAFEYGKRLAATDRLVRGWIREKGWMTIPPFIPVGLEEMGYNVPWIERDTPPNFWEQVQYRDPVPDHLHAVIPGHRFDDHVRRNLDHPIRRHVRSHARWQGWAVYLEEAPLQAGILEANPRARELIYIFGLWRAARTLGDVYGQRNDKTAMQVVDWWMDVTPLMDRNVARKYAYLRPMPGFGLDYTTGNVQMFTLLGDMKRKHGEKFDMKAFHDELMTKGQIPVELIRAEMTGDEALLKRFFERTPLAQAGLGGG
ncbi:MAG: DUF885 family protein, partial [Pseudomonadota bacterium]